MAKDEIKVKFRAETSDMNAAIKASNNELKQLRSEMKLNEAQMKNSGSSADTLKQRHQILANQLEQNKAKQEALSQKIEVAKKFYGENSDEVNKLKTSLNYAKIEEEQIKAKIEETNNALKNQSNRAEETANKLDKVGNDLTKAGKSASIMSAGIVAAGKGAVDAFSEVEKGADAVVTATGATGEAAESLIDVYENVAGSVVGSFESIGGAVGEVNTRFGFVGEELETCSNKFIKFADITGTDAVKAVQDVSRYMGDAGIASSEYGSVLDQLAVAAQASGIQVDKLAESCTKYGAPMRALGFDTKESIAIFASWEKAGVNTETAFSGMKKAISNWSAAGKDARVEFKATLDEIAKCPDIASATTKAIEVFGSKAGPDLADAIQGGRFEYEEMLALIENSEGVLESTYEEWENGTQKTDKALQNLKLAASGVGESIMNTLTPAIEWGSNALSGFADWWEGLGSGMQTAILVVAGVVAAIGPMLIIIGQMSIGLGSVVDFTSKFSGNLGFVKKALGLLAGPVGIVVAAIVALAAAFKWGYDNVEPFRNAVDQLWGALSQAFGPIVEMIGTELMGAFTDLCNFVSENAPGAFQAFADFIMNYIVPAVSNFGSFLNDFVIPALSDMWSWIQQNLIPALSDFWGWFSSNILPALSDFWGFVSANIIPILGQFASFIFGTVVPALSEIWRWFSSNIIPIFQSAWGAVQTGIGIFSQFATTVANTINNAKNIVSDGLNAISRFFSGLRLEFPHIKLPHFTITGSFNINPPSVPSFGISWWAKGGIMTQPTIFGLAGRNLLAGGEAGPEAILPIERLQGFIDSAFQRNIQGKTTVYNIGDVSISAKELKDIATIDNFVDVLRRAKTAYPTRG